MLFPGDDAGWLDFFGALYIWFTSLAVLCTAVALIASGGIKRYSDRIGNAQRLQIAEAKERASKADERAGKANQSAGEAQERAAKLETRASEAEARATTSEAEIAKANAASKQAVAKVADAEARSAEASAKAEVFRLDIAKANESAAQANRVAEQERLVRVRIEEIMGGWRLSTEARARLTERLKPFAGTEFEFFANPDESPFLTVIDKAMEEAGWKRLSPSLGPITLGNNKASILYIPGLFVEVREDMLSRYFPAIQAFINGLMQEGLAVKANVVKKESMESTTLHIVIGRRE
jgi:multidrug efflux pump subunit AcrA (membrane-fusion protein)